MKSDNRTKGRIIAKKYRNIKIIGENILCNENIVSAYYVLPTLNYSVSSSESVERAIDSLYSLITNVSASRPKLKFTIERIDKVVKSEDVKRNLVETIKIYAPNYDMPREFSDFIRSEIQSYCLLCIQIENDDLGDIEEYTIKETITEIGKKLIDKMAGTFSSYSDESKLIEVEKNIFSHLSSKCVRASRELVFYNYISKLYPSYEISYDRLSFIKEDNFNNILGAISQRVSDNFGYFVMHNDSIDFFDLPQQDTFGCILDVKNVPVAVLKSNFPMNFEGTKIQVSLLKKEDARLKLKRLKGDELYELKEGQFAGIDTEDEEANLDSVELITQALRDIKNGDVMCRFNLQILVTGSDLRDVKQQVKDIISVCKEREILVTKSLDQAKDFFYNFVLNKPQDYHFFSSLYLPLASQLNAGSIVGDVGSKFASYAIGEDIS